MSNFPVAVDHNAIMTPWRLAAILALAVVGSLAFVKRDRAEALYQRSIERRYETITRLYGSVEAAPPFGRKGSPTYLWDFFWPAWNCAWKERWGAVSEGGKWVCHPDILVNLTECVVYSFGVRGDVSFELELARRTHCKVRMYDPTVDGTPIDHPSFDFHKMGLGPTKSPLNVRGSKGIQTKTLAELMDEHGDRHIDLLKVDIEWSEWAVFRQLGETDFWPFSQLLIELHIPNAPYPRVLMPEVFAFFDRLEKNGYRIFSSEINLAPAVHKHGANAYEYGFVRNPSRFTPRFE